MNTQITILTFFEKISGILTRENITLGIAILGAVISLYNLFSNYLHSRRKFDIQIIKITHFNNFLVAYLCFENKSRLPISITSISIETGGKIYSGFSVPPHTFKVKLSENNTFIGYSEHQTILFPVNLGSLSGASGYISFDISKEVSESLSTPLTFLVSTNRGCLKKMKLKYTELTPWNHMF